MRFQAVAYILANGIEKPAAVLQYFAVTVAFKFQNGAPWKIKKVDFRIIGFFRNAGNRNLIAYLRPSVYKSDSGRTFKIVAAVRQVRY